MNIIETNRTQLGNINKHVKLISNYCTNTIYQIFICQSLKCKNTQATTTNTKKYNLQSTNSPTIWNEDTQDHSKQYPKISGQNLITPEYTGGNTELCKALIRKTNCKIGSYDKIN